MRYLSFILWLLVANNSFAQIEFGFEFEKGFVVDSKGDTLQGKIQYGTEYERSLRCVFIANGGNGEHIRFQPFQIKSYFVKNEIYDSKIYDYNPAAANGFGVFMRRLNNGQCKVYEYWNSDKERGFTQTFLEKDGKSMTEVRAIRFKEQMMEYFKDFPQLSAKIGRGAFKRSELLKIVGEYNAWRASGW